MEQAEFKRALAKFERQKQKRLAAQLAASPDAPKINTALPLQPAVIQTPKKEKKQYIAPKTKPLEVVITGPVELKFIVEWTGTILGGQMNPQTMKDLFLKNLRAFGVVKQA